MAIGDIYWDNVVLAMHMDGADNGTTFTDVKGRSISRFGNTVTKTAVKKFGTASAYFDGSGDYLTIPNPGDLNFGSSDFAIEFWINPTSVSTIQMIYLHRTNVAPEGVGIQIGASGKIGFFCGDFNTSVWEVQLESSNSLTPGVWTHVACVRNGSTFTIYLNGVANGTAASNVNIATSTNAARIGVSDSSDYYFTGYLDDFLITKGVAKYVANFTPPTSAFPEFAAQILGTVRDSFGNFARRLVRAFRRLDGKLSGEVLSNPSTGAFTINTSDLSKHTVVVHDADAWITYLPMNGDAGYTSSGKDPAFPQVRARMTFDTALNDIAGGTVSNSGVTISTSQKVFGAGSAAFNGSASFSITPQSAVVATGDFTIEMWMYGNLAYPCTFFFGDFAGNSYLYLYNNTLSGYGFSVSGLNLDTANVWKHIAIVRSGTTITVYQNGVARGSTTWANAITLSPFDFGRYKPNNNLYFTGNIDDLRVTVGVARYTANFTLPAAALPIEGVSNVFYEYGGKQVTAYGQAHISTAQSKFGGASALFDGNGDYLMLEPLIGRRTAWTVECWVRFNATNVAQYVWSQFNGAVQQVGRCGCYLKATGKVEFFINGLTGGNLAIEHPASLASGQWYHIAVVRDSSSNFTLFVDGVASATTQRTGDIVVLTSAPFGIGILTDQLVSPLAGYIDDFRVSDGVARYTANFTPPTQPHMTFGIDGDPLWGNVSALFRFNGSEGQTSFQSADGLYTLGNTQGVYNAYITTSDSKFGGSCLHLSASSQVGDMPASVANTGGSDFTVEFWMKSLEDSQSIPILQSVAPTGIHLLIGVVDSRIYVTPPDGSGSSFTPLGAVTVAKGWQHVAVVRVGSTIATYINGVLSVSASKPGTYTDQSGWRLGTASTWKTVLLQDLRITKGVARYTANFTPPSAPHPLGPTSFTNQSANAVVYDMIQPV